MLDLNERYKTMLIGIIKFSFTVPVEVWAYGSRVNGGSHDASDLDLVIRSVDTKPIDLKMMRNFIERLKNSNIPILVEARDWALLPESFHKQILKNHEPLFPEKQ